jgi:ABC-2 type transport system ATP-binding protein
VWRVIGEVVSAVGVGKRYGALHALQDVNLAIRRGESVAVLGSNGAGKSTLLEILTGLRRPDRGEVRLCGFDPRSRAARLRLGSTPQDTAFVPQLTVREIISFVGAHYVRPTDLRRLSDAFGLGAHLDKRTRLLSGGQRRSVALALAFCGNPEVVVLDEPTSGLDIDAREAFWAHALRYVTEGGTLLVSTHQFDEVVSLADRVCVLERGSLTHDRRLSDLATRTSEVVVVVAYGSAPSPRVELPSILVARQRVYLTDDPERLVGVLVGFGVAASALAVRSPTMEERLRFLFCAGARDRSQAVGPGHSGSIAEAG